MKTPVEIRNQFEFCFSKLDTLVLVEAADDEVVIRATKGSFSERRKVQFIHELAAEGFIPESYRWFSGFEQGTWLRVRWLVDPDWLKLNEAVPARTQHVMIRVFVCAGLLWTGLMIALFVYR